MVSPAAVCRRIAVDAECRWIVQQRRIDGDAPRIAGHLRAAAGDRAGVERVAVGKQRQLRRFRLATTKPSSSSKRQLTVAKADPVMLSVVPDGFENRTPLVPSAAFNCETIDAMPPDKLTPISFGLAFGAFLQRQRRRIGDVDDRYLLLGVGPVVV